MPRTAPDFHLNADWERLLKEAGIEFETLERDSDKICVIDCPYCDDGEGKKKGWISWSTAKFHCHKGCTALGLDVLVKRDAKWRVKFDRLYRNKKRNSIIDNETVNGYMRMWEQYGKYEYAKQLKKALEKRGVSEQEIKQYKIGLQPSTGHAPARATIPIYDDYGNWIQIKKYLPSDFKSQWPSASKFLCELKNNYAFLFPFDQITRYSSLVLCGGECKAIHAARVLNTQNIGAITVTGGENCHLNELAYFLEGKAVTICYDADPAGRKGAIKACWDLHGIAREVRLVSFPPDMKAKSDINDYINEYGDQSFIELVKNAPAWERPAVDISQPDLRRLQNPDSESDVFSGAQLCDLEDVSPGWFQATDIVLNGVFVDVYAIPAEIEITCSRNDPACAFCPVMQEAVGKRYSVSPDKQDVIALIGANAKDETAQIRKICRVPPKCASYKHVITKQIPARMCTMSPEKPGKQHSMLSVVFNNFESGNTGVSLDVQGFLAKTNKGTPAFFITDVIGSNKSIKGFELSDEEITQMRAVLTPQTTTVESIHEHLTQRYLDLSYNVTQIYNCMDLHLLYDLMFFSAPVLWLDRPFHQQILGTVKVFAVGETGMGKSKTLQSLHKHYGSLGKIIDGPNTTTAGITAGLIKTLEGYKIQLGEFASMHERMIGLEEMSGMHEDVIGSIKETLSSGKIRITKVQSTPDVDANVRVAITSNFIDDAKLILGSVQQINKLLELFQGQSILRRFDAGIIVGGSKNTTPTVTEQRLNAALCTKHLKWAWNMRGITFSDAALLAIIECEKQMITEFDTSIGLVTAGDQRNKIARLSAALAILLFQPQVEPAHVEYVHAFYKRLYSSETFGYDSFTRAYAGNEVIDEKAAELFTSSHNFQILRAELLKRRSYTLSTIRSICADFTAVVYTGLIQSNVAIITSKTDRRGESICEVTAAGNAFLQKCEDRITKTKPEYLQ